MKKISVRKVFSHAREHIVDDECGRRGCRRLTRARMFMCVCVLCLLHLQKNMKQMSFTRRRTNEQKPKKKKTLNFFRCHFICKSQRTHCALLKRIRRIGEFKYIVCTIEERERARTHRSEIGRVNLWCVRARKLKEVRRSSGHDTRVHKVGSDKMPIIFCCILFEFKSPDDDDDDVDAPRLTRERSFAADFIVIPCAIHSKLFRLHAS